MNLNKVSFAYLIPNKFLKRLLYFIKKYYFLPKLLNVEY